MTAQLVMIALPFIFCCMLVEHYFAKRQAKYSLRSFAANLQHAIAKQSLDIFIRALFIGCYILLYNHFRITNIPFHWISWVVVFLCHDFLEYWVHRAMHHFHVLWGMHLIHHSAEEMNLSVSLRHPWFSTLFNTIPLYLFAIAGVSPLMLVTISTVSFVASFWTHTEAIPKLGWLERILITPSLHRVHHGCNNAYLDKNFGQILSIWDQIFGTYIDETEKPVYGLTLPVHTDNPLWENLYYYAFLIKVVRRTKGIGQKMRLFLQSITKLNERFSKQELMSLMQPENKKGEIHPQTKWRGWRILLVGILMASLGLVLTMMAMEDNWTTVQKIMGV
ncbi:MAG TPA: sterol desaturase family protein, partial [Saprospiraceae bacterium]|nr:sterol desaturase family protein [Saprospiraceae bacterium]